MRDSTAGRLLLYRLGPVVCATPALAVREVVPSVRPVRIPGAPAPVAGLVNLRGQLLTVVDGRLAVGTLPDHDQPEGFSSVVVLARGARMAGLAVDEILDLALLPDEDQVDGPPPAEIPAAMVQGIRRYEGRLVVVLDTEALLIPLLG
jgi:purine-binding chemotaxis protein CheW